MAWQNAWNGTTAYVVGDEVFYGGGSYICVANNTNTSRFSGSGVIGGGGGAAWGPLKWYLI